MKFGAELDAKIYEPWRSSYLQYNKLKIEFKRRQLSYGWQPQDENEFINALEKELERVYTFVKSRLRDLHKRTTDSEIALASATTGPTFDGVADTVAEILLDVNDVARFHHLNMTGFEKLVKKHDRWTATPMKPYFRDTMLKKWPLDKLPTFDELIVRLSNIHDACQLHGQRRADAYGQGKDQTAFERATAKYWIHPDNVTEVKSIILFHLPVHVFNRKKQFEAADAAVSSVYFDNDAFDLYSERLDRAEGGEAIRFRWYGQDNRNIYIERKTHHAPWFNGHSVKDRFRLIEDQVNSYVQGEYTANDIARDLRAKGKLDEVAIEDNHFVASGIQHSIQARRLQPMCRVFYNRTAFQLPGDQRLRLSLDCNLTFIREDTLDGIRRRPAADGRSNWRRTDVGIDYPFRYVDDKDILRFPYAVLETKIQNHLGQQVPAWLTALLESHLVHEVPRFSKYLHGASQLFGNRVPTAPWWLSELELDIRKPPVANVGLSRSMSLKPLVNGHHRRSLVEAPPREKKIPHIAINLDASEPERKPGLRTTDSKDGKRDILSRIWLHPASLAKLTQEKGFMGQPPTPPAKDLPSYKPPMSRTVPPRRRTEPKTFFANERTFISWLQFCALLLTVALNLLNNGDRISRIIGAIFIIISSLLSFYALGRFQFRAWQLRTGRNIIRYDDIYGPTILCVMLVTALILNFYLRAPTLSSNAPGATSNK
ncbi:VTC domain-containing protein [Radiomyces spectabilis]|uniref:VTC domain-containing protein n=1 Tax=Radiomyces spectabilis TaxID=64574 RepID=UPI0022202751|nr:VTC domain-containing protein [Radiomyces spectabilis]KAI8377892.1 VTC domain-containing protein [Radiomyces spectabilis]